MSRLFLWYLLTLATGSPVASLIAVLALWWIGDRLTFRLLPDPLRALARWRRRALLRGVLADNPHDRRARFELAELLLEAGRPGEAAAVLRPNIEAGDEDVHTAYLMGAALARSGVYEHAERVLAVAREVDAGFRLGEIDLELGRLRLARGDPAGASGPLRRLVAARPGTVQGRFYLARALAAQGDAAGAERARQEAWREYAALPRFRRRGERPFAWRIRPWRPAVAAVAVILAGVLAASFFLPWLHSQAPERPVPARVDPGAER